MLTAQRNTAVRDQLLRRLSEARRQSDDLFNVVHPDSLYERPIPERHRIVFYIGHLEAFDWNLLSENVFGLKSSHPEFDQLFAFGIDPVGGGLPSDQPSDWPTLSVARDYVCRVRAALDARMTDATSELRSRTDEGPSLDTFLNVAVEHRLMHLETLAYMLHQLPLSQKFQQTDRGDLVPAPVNHRMLEIPTGIATLGLTRHSETFGWDNEYEACSVQVPAFEIDQYMVTNCQYLDFMDAGGYQNHDFWSDDNWQWKGAHAVSSPVFWKKSKEQWLYRTMFEEVPLPMDWPVYVSHAEAAAFARWAGKSLPTEDEWHRAAYGTASGQQRLYPWGDMSPARGSGNFDFHHWNPAPVNAYPDGQSAFGAHGMLGNGWEWTSSVFAPFQGFEPFPFYRRYSADFFDGKHFVMKGGSARTAACMLRPTFRNWFQANYQYVYAGFRCVRR